MVWPSAGLRDRVSAIGSRSTAPYLSIPERVVALLPGLARRDNRAEMGGRVSSPALVGRVEELQALEASGSSAIDGSLGSRRRPGIGRIPLFVLTRPLRRL